MVLRPPRCPPLFLIDVGSVALVFPSFMVIGVLYANYTDTNLVLHAHTTQSSHTSQVKL